MQYYVNESIKNATRIFPRQGRGGYHRYDLNENPEGLPKAFVDSVVREITPEFLATYPEPDRFLFKYAKFIGVKRENVMATNGSDMAIRYLMETFGERGKDVVTVSPSFEMYWVNCMLLGYRHVSISYEPDLTIDIDKILAAITENTRIVALVNPNNPVGNVYAESDFNRIADKAESVGAVLIIDEAYHYFYSETFLSNVLKRPNAVILRTFSKLMSLAACRLGVIIGNPEIIHYVNNSRLTFDVNSFALLFAEKILDHPELIHTLIAIEKAGKEHALAELRAHGYECCSSMANFILLKTKNPPMQVAERLEKEKKILVHTFKNELLVDYLRISTGSKEAMETFLRAFFEIDV
ncbi:MAG: histidinol-phosphate aminotransferase family protein [Provencibacterium sp.]|nr:histidinol-phosphate aminotransferase family protein [Provencibacterium sp.]